MTDITALRDFALDHPDKPYLHEAPDEISRLRRLRQDNEAVIAQLQNDLREARKEQLIPGLEEAVRVIEGMNTDWPDAIGRSLGDDYGRQFASRIRDRIESNRRRLIK